MRSLSRALFWFALLLIGCGLVAVVCLDREAVGVWLLVAACVPLGIDVWLTYQEGTP